MNESALWVQFENFRFVLGMEWRLLEPTEKLVRGTLRQYSTTCARHNCFHDSVRACTPSLPSSSSSTYRVRTAPCVSCCRLLTPALSVCARRSK